MGIRERLNGDIRDSQGMNMPIHICQWKMDARFTGVLDKSPDSGKMIVKCEDGRSCCSHHLILVESRKEVFTENIRRTCADGNNMGGMTHEESDWLHIQHISFDCWVIPRVSCGLCIIDVSIRDTHGY